MSSTNSPSESMFTKGAPVRYNDDFQKRLFCEWEVLPNQDGQIE